MAIITTEIIVTVMTTVRVKVQIATVAVDLVIITMMAARPDARSEGHVSNYSSSAGRRQQPLVHFNEIKTCLALCLGSSLSFFSSSVWKCVLKRNAASPQPQKPRKHNTNRAVSVSRRGECQT